MIESRDPIVALTAAPPGSPPTAAGSSRMMRTFRRVLPRSLTRDQGYRGSDGGQRAELEALVNRRRRVGRLRGEHGLRELDGHGAVGGLGGEPVADPEVGVDVAPGRR